MASILNELLCSETMTMAHRLGLLGTKDEIETQGAILHDEVVVMVMIKDLRACTRKIVMVDYNHLIIAQWAEITEISHHR